MRPFPKDKRGSRWTGLGGCLGQFGDELFAGGPAVLGNTGQGAVDNRSFGACQHTQVRFGTNISGDELRRAVCERKPVPAQDAIGDRQAILIGPFTEAALKNFRGSEIERPRLEVALQGIRVDGGEAEVAQLHCVIKKQDVAGLDIAMADGHESAVDLMLTDVEEIEAFGRLAQVETGLVRGQSGAKLRLADTQQIQQVAVRQLHFDDQVARLTPDFLDGDQIGMADVTEGANGTDFLGGGQLLTAGKEFQGHQGVVRLLGFPDVAVPSPAQQPPQLVSGANLLADLQCQRFSHVDLLLKVPRLGRRAAPTKARPLRRRTGASTDWNGTHDAAGEPSGSLATRHDRVCPHVLLAYRVAVVILSPTHGCFFYPSQQLCFAQFLREGAAQGPFFARRAVSPDNQRLHEPGGLFGAVGFADSDNRGRFELVRTQQPYAAAGNIRHAGRPAQFVFALNILAKDLYLNGNPIPGTSFFLDWIIHDLGARRAEHGRLQEGFSRKGI